MITNVGYVMPPRRYREWEFYPGSDLSKIAAEMAEAVVEYGFPFMEHAASLESLADMFQANQYGARATKAYDYPVVLAKLQRLELARAVLMEELEFARANTTSLVDIEEYRVFADRFCDEFELRRLD